ncbi:MAG: hypothetical protein ACLRQ1_10880 [Ruminococcus sp.]|uniref:hypothetical protein n=1 Tax=Oscillospiraceae TaxID=216572 RepID=UPI00315F8737
MEKKKSNNTITTLIVLLIAVGVGSFVCTILEHTEINVWIARGIGACVTIVVGFICNFIVRKIKNIEDN